jgi:hypothetical protein
MVRFSNADAQTETHVFCLRVRQSARIVKAFLDIAGEMARTNLPHAQQRRLRAARKS